MSTDKLTDKMTTMTTPSADRLERGKRLEEWAKAQHGRVAQLLRHSSIKSRDTVYAAFAGTASYNTYDVLEAAREHIEANPADQPDQPAMATKSDSGQVIEFEVTVDAVGLRVFVRGPVENADDIERQAARVFRQIRQDIGED